MLVEFFDQKHVDTCSIYTVSLFIFIVYTLYFTIYTIQF